MSKNGNRNGLADPSRLKPVDKDAKELVRGHHRSPKRQPQRICDQEQNIREAIQLYLESLIEDSLPIPTLR